MEKVDGDTNKKTDKHAGQTDEIEARSNTESRQINRQPDRKANRAVLSRRTHSVSCSQTAAG